MIDVLGITTVGRPGLDLDVFVDNAVEEGTLAGWKLTEEALRAESALTAKYGERVAVPGFKRIGCVSLEAMAADGDFWLQYRVDEEWQDHNIAEVATATAARQLTKTGGLRAQFRLFAYANDAVFEGFASSLNLVIAPRAVSKGHSLSIVKFSQADYTAQAEARRKATV